LRDMKAKCWVRLVVFSLALVLMTGLAGCGSSQPAGQPAAPKVATAIRHSEVVVFWDPSDTFSNEIIALQNIYETLLRYDPFEDKLIPILATEYSTSEDGLVWTFKLREGVKFHTGNPFNADAVKYSIERTIERGMGASFIWHAVDEIRVVDEYTVEFILKYPAPLDIIAAAGYGAYIFDPVVTEEKGHEWFLEGNACGTGPYMVESWERGQELVLTKFEEYWGGWKDHHFDKVVQKVVPEASTRRHMLEAGEADYIEALPFEHIEALQANPDITISVTPSFQSLFGHLNTEKPPLDNKLVRQALSYAMPYDGIIDHVMYGYARQSRGAVPYGLWGHDESLFQYTHDLDRARQLLEEAGYPGGGFSLVLTYVSGDDFERRTAELYKAELAKLGIDLEIRGMPWESQWDLAKSPNPMDRQDIFLFYWWPDVADPISFLQGMFYSEDEIVFNLCYYKNPEYDALVDEANMLSGLDRDRASQFYAQAQEHLIEDAAALYIYDQQYVRPLRSNFKGYKDNPAYPHVVFFYDCYREE